MSGIRYVVVYEKVIASNLVFTVEYCNIYFLKWAVPFYFLDCFPHICVMCLLSGFILVALQFLFYKQNLFPLCISYPLFYFSMKLSVTFQCLFVFQMSRKGNDEIIISSPYPTSILVLIIQMDSKCLDTQSLEINSPWPGTRASLRHCLIKEFRGIFLI